MGSSFGGSRTRRSQMSMFPSGGARRFVTDSLRILDEHREMTPGFEYTFPYDSSEILYAPGDDAGAGGALKVLFSRLASKSGKGSPPPTPRPCQGGTWKGNTSYVKLGEKGQRRTQQAVVKLRKRTEPSGLHEG